ncbi:MAG: cytochrome c biogenesis protein CcsA [Gammaproteobacteria bacterium]|nr:cytochrome c biogenesis protein CcsA [Gammaproteobacteria bacterium]
MNDSLLNCLTASLYAVAGLVLWRRLLRGKISTGAMRYTIIAVGLTAVFLHALILRGDLWLEAGLNLAFTNAASLIAWAVAVLFLLTTLCKRIDNLGIVIMPLAALAVVAAWIWPGAHVLSPKGTTAQATHIIISLLAYGLLSLTAVQSLLLLAQEGQLKQRHFSAFMRALPPLQTMERLMFQLMGLGFVLLTLTLISGAFFSEQLFGQPFRFTHHVILSVFAWIVFAALLLGHWRFGWRGRPAIRWTLGGFALLLLAYFGTKLVLELILGR